MDTAVQGGRLAADGSNAFNTTFDSSNGSAAIGLNYRFHTLARWTIVSPPEIWSETQSSRNGTRWLYIMAEAPQFFSADGYDRVYVGNALVGQIRSILARSGSGFTADLSQQTILMPPGRTFGYRFALADDGSCSRIACNVTIRGSWSFWHVYRFAIVREKPRFIALQNQ